MPSNIISNMTLVAGAGGTLDVQPPAGQAYVIRGFGSQHAFVGAVPDVQVAIRDGVLADAIVVLDPATLPSKGTRPLELYITNANYMRLTNTGGVNAYVSHFGELVNPVNVRTDLVAVGGGLTVAVRPPAGETWRISEVGYSAWGAGNPNCVVGFRDAAGVLVASILLTGANHKGREKHPDWYINNAIYLCVTDLVGGGGGVFGYSGLRVNKVAISSIQDLAGSGTLDIQPAPTREYTITDIGAETYAGGGAPNNYPNINVSMRVGANLSDVAEPGAGASLIWNRDMALDIDNTHYLRITEISTANNEIAISGFLKREFS